MSIANEARDFAAVPGVYVPQVVTPQAIANLRTKGMARLASTSHTTATNAQSSGGSVGLVIFALAAAAAVGIGVAVARRRHVRR